MQPVKERSEIKSRRAFVEVTYKGTKERKGKGREGKERRKKEREREGFVGECGGCRCLYAIYDFTSPRKF